MDSSTQSAPASTASSQRAGSLRLEASLQHWAASQFGCFTVQQAAASGLAPTALLWRKRAGLIVPMFPGVYRLAAVEETPEQVVLAACLAVPGSVVGGLSAARLHGLPVRGADGDRPTLIVDARTTVRMTGVAVHRTRHPYLTQPWKTVRVTQVSSTLIRLAAVLPQVDVARCLDAAIARRLVSVARLLQEVEARPSARFMGRSALLEEIHARSDQRVLHRSRHEQNVDRWIRTSGLPAPVSNYRVPILGRNEVVEVDKAWPTHRVALEISPFFTHGSATTQRRDMQRRVWLQESHWRFVEAADEHVNGPASFTPIIESLARLLGIVCV